MVLLALLLVFVGIVIGVIAVQRERLNAHPSDPAEQKLEAEAIHSYMTYMRNYQWEKDKVARRQAAAASAASILNIDSRHRVVSTEDVLEWTARL